MVLYVLYWYFLVIFCLLYNGNATVLSCTSSYYCILVGAFYAPGTNVIRCGYVQQKRMFKTAICPRQQLCDCQHTP